MRKTEPNIQELLDNIKRCNICIIKLPEEQERENGEEAFEVITAKTVQTTDLGSSVD